jgi:hypothetical protein
MQRCNVLVALNGNTGSQVPKYDVTVAEIILLMATHGRDSVTRLPGRAGENNVEHREEYIRLAHVYGEDTVKNVFGASAFSVKFPTRLADLSLELPDDDEEEKKPAPRAGAVSGKGTRGGGKPKAEQPEGGESPGGSDPGAGGETAAQLTGAADTTQADGPDAGNGGEGEGE